MNTESIQQMLEPKGHLTAEAAAYFCKLLELKYPESTFIQGPVVGYI